MADIGFVQFRTRFFVPEDRHVDALSALKASEYGAVVGSARTLADGLAALHWRVHRDAEGTIDDILADDGYPGAPEVVFGALAPFVRSGSHVVIAYVRGGAPPPVMLVFDGKQMKVRALTKREMNEEDILEKPSFDEESPVQLLQTWGTAQASMPQTRARYGASASFSVGDWLEHPKFGPGLVLSRVDGNKVRVLFASGERSLVHGT